MKRQEYSAMEKRFFRGARFLGRHGWIMGLTALVAFGGCAATQVNTISHYAGPVPRPNNVLVS
jgi:hypothetical protein